jgi:hypothetical protein
MMKTTPRPSLFPNHCEILPSRYSFTVSRTSFGITFMMSARWASALTVSMASTPVVGAGAVV